MKRAKRALSPPMGLAGAPPYRLNFCPDSIIYFIGNFMLEFLTAENFGDSRRRLPRLFEGERNFTEQLRQVCSQLVQQLWKLRGKFLGALDSGGNVGEIAALENRCRNMLLMSCPAGYFPAYAGMPARNFWVKKQLLLLIRGKFFFYVA